jgi:hypothetical protein
MDLTSCGLGNFMSYPLFVCAWLSDTRWRRVRQWVRKTSYATLVPGHFVQSNKFGLKTTPDVSSNGYGAICGSATNIAEIGLWHVLTTKWS